MLHMTPDQLEAAYKDGMDRLMAQIPSVYHLALMLDVNPSTIHSWINRGRISKEGARQVMKNKILNTKFTLADLRPDLKA